MTDLEIITWHLRGSCVTINNQIHGLFKMTSRKRDTAAYERSFERALGQTDQAATR